MGDETEFRSAVDNLPFFAQGQWANHRQGIIVVAHQWRHRCKFSLFHHVHEQGFEDVVHVVAKCQLVEAVGSGVAGQLDPALG